MGKKTQNPTAVTVYEDVSPALAEEYLKKNTHNRALNKNVVAKYASTMRAGKWLITHQGIAFNAAGDLIDGQHRLWAIIKAGVTVRLAVTRNLDGATQLVLDTGQRRSISQNLSLLGKPNVQAVTAWANLAYMAIRQVDRTWLCADDVLQIYTDCDEALTAIACLNHSHMRAGPVGAAFLLSYPKSPEKVFDFFQAFCAGTNLTEGSAAYAAFKYFFQSSTRQKDRRYEVALKLLRCIQAHIEGETFRYNNLIAGKGAVLYFAKSHAPETVFKRIYSEAEAREA